MTHAANFSSTSDLSPELMPVLSEGSSQESSLEFIQEFIQEQTAPVPSRLQQLWQQVQHFCIRLAARSLATLQIYHELQVHQYHDRSGNCWWRIDNPMTGASNSFATEEEALIWLERRYLR